MEANTSSQYWLAEFQDYLVENFPLTSAMAYTISEHVREKMAKRPVVPVKKDVAVLHQK